MIPRLRLAAQAAFLALSLAVFFGLVRARGVVSLYHALHLFPSLAQLPWLTPPRMGLVTAAVILASLLFGRLYCSFLCPVGTVQDLARQLGKVLQRSSSQRASSTVTWTLLRFLILGFCLSSAFSRSSSYHYFDHLSNLGRFYGLARALRAGGPFGWNFFLGTVFLAAIVFVPLVRPRWFCAALCPSGTLFMLAHKFAPGKVRAAGCPGDCGRCAEVCPALCIEGGDIDHDLCVDCLECVGACSTGAMKWTWGRPRPAKSEPPRLAQGMSRRQVLAALGMTLGGGILGDSAGAYVPPPTAAVPPGGKDFATFLQRCVACGACASICPTKVLRSSERGLGWNGAAKPTLDFSAGYCAYECNACLSVCPSGAISYFPLPAKKRIRIGASRLVKNLCIPYAQGKDCGACQEACPTGAIAMEPYRSIRAPVVRNEYCIGCGACQFACPTKPRKAIEVYPVRTHGFSYAPRPATKLDCRSCAKPGGGQACWRCRPAAEADEGFPF